MIKPARLIVCALTWLAFSASPGRTMGVRIHDATAPIQNPIANRATMSDEELMREVVKAYTANRFRSDQPVLIYRRLKELVNTERESAGLSVVRALLRNSEEELALHNLKIAMYYLKQQPSNIIGAEMRLQVIIEQFPAYSRTDEVLYQLGMIKARDARPDEAAADFETIVKNWSWSPRAKDAQEQLDKLR